MSINEEFGKNIFILCKRNIHKIIGILCIGLFLNNCAPSTVRTIQTENGINSITSPETIVKTLRIQTTETKTQSITAITSNKPTVAITNFPLEIPRIIVAYSKNNGVYIIESPDPPIMIKEDVIPDIILISDDASKVVYRMYRRAIHAVDSDGKGEKILFTPQQIADLESLGRTTEDTSYNWKWIPDTHHLLFSTMNYNASGGWAAFENLFQVDVDTNLVQRIFTAGDGGEAWPSPDAQKIAITHNDTIFLSSINGNVLFQDIINIGNLPHWSVDIVWSVDSSLFKLIVPSKYYDRSRHNSKEPISAEIWMVDALSGIALLQNKIDNFGYGILSPKLDSIGFTRPGKDLSTDETYISSIDGSFIIKLATGPSGVISFSPDGRHFAYYLGTLPENHIPCFGNSAKTEIIVGSLGGEVIPIPGKIDPLLFRWVNNSQFIFVSGQTLQLGDIGGYLKTIDTSTTCISQFAVKDLDLQG